MKEIKINSTDVFNRKASILQAVSQMNEDSNELNFKLLKLHYLSKPALLGILLSSGYELVSFTIDAESSVRATAIVKRAE